MRWSFIVESAETKFFCSSSMDFLYFLKIEPGVLAIEKILRSIRTYVSM